MKQKITLQDAIIKRKSIRDYDMTPLSEKELKEITDYLDGIEPLLSGLKTKVRIITPDNVKAIRSWRSPHFLAIYANSDDMALVNVGYVYEQLVVYLTSLGLGTCWANSVSPKDTKEYEGMKWAATIAFGREKNGQPWRENASEIKRQTLAAISDKEDDRLEAARIAPSAMNNQPWYFVHDGEKIRAYCVVQGFMKKWMTSMNRIDMGIAIANVKMGGDDFKFEIEKAPAEVKGYTYIGTIEL